MSLFTLSASEKEAKILACIKNPMKYAQDLSELDGVEQYKKLLSLYEGVKDKEENHIELFVKGETVLLSPKMVYLHLKNKTPFAEQLVQLAVEMEENVGGKVNG